MIFYDIENGENVDFKGFYRTRYRTQNGGRGMDGTDVPFLASGALLQNVNIAPIMGEKIL